MDLSAEILSRIDGSGHVEQIAHLDHRVMAPFGDGRPQIPFADRTAAAVTTAASATVLMGPRPSR